MSTSDLKAQRRTPDVKIRAHGAGRSRRVCIHVAINAVMAGGGILILTGKPRAVAA
ncbi:hypothetical protein K491DRAFT_690884 [Lophiostoma macrostomum CBS 122681]|uniref:Uncharacterized protein n=1 Tax=Lophiostoma macrostomum CBS 122681 TaxID=1314788 RepID=A0A6A6TE96_9PLEO|nr:hypothetical protein K491DRAFT_690884 [Lophiostoma macrostomum CBS 122681]